MVGRLCWSSGRKPGLREEMLFGLPVAVLELSGQARRPEHALKKGAVRLKGYGVTRVLAPPEFDGWPILSQWGIRPVDTGQLRCTMTPAWVRTQLTRKGIAPEDACVCLSGDRGAAELEPVARLLCGVVRNLIFDAPGGDALAQKLRRRYGLPVLSARAGQAHLTVRFESGPVLPGLELSLRGALLPQDCDRLALISILWETGRIKQEEIVLQG